MALKVTKNFISLSSVPSAAFTIIQPDFGTTPVADSIADTLTMTSSDGTIVITGDSTTDTIDFEVNPDLNVTTLTATGKVTADEFCGTFASTEVPYAVSGGCLTSNSDFRFGDSVFTRLELGESYSTGSAIPVLKLGLDATRNMAFSISNITDPVTTNIGFTKITDVQYKQEGSATSFNTVIVQNGVTLDMEFTNNATHVHKTNSTITAYSPTQTSQTPTIFQDNFIGDEQLLLKFGTYSTSGYRESHIGTSTFLRLLGTYDLTTNTTLSTASAALVATVDSSQRYNIDAPGTGTVLSSNFGCFITIDYFPAAVDAGITETIFNAGYYLAPSRSSIDDDNWFIYNDNSNDAGFSDPFHAFMGGYGCETVWGRLEDFSMVMPDAITNVIDMTFELGPGDMNLNDGSLDIEHDLRTNKRDPLKYAAFMGVR